MAKRTKHVMAVAPTPLMHNVTFRMDVDVDVDVSFPMQMDHRSSARLQMVRWVSEASRIRNWPCSGQDAESEELLKQ